MARWREASLASRPPTYTSKQTSRILSLCVQLKKFQSYKYKAVKQFRNLIGLSIALV